MVPPSLTSEAVYWAAAGNATTRKTRDQASRMVFLLGRALYRPAPDHLEQNCAVVPARRDCDYNARPAGRPATGLSRSAQRFRPTGIATGTGLDWGGFSGNGSG